MELERKDALVLCLFVGLTLGFFFEPIFSDKVLYSPNLLTIFYPLRHLFSSEIRTGNIPLWNPYQGFGEPLFLDPNAGLFYPFHVFYLLRNSLTVFLSLTITHYFLAAFFQYGLIRRLGCHPMAAFVGSVCFAFSGFLLSNFDDTRLLTAMVWTPLALLFFHFSLQRRDVRLGALTGLILSIQFVSGGWEIFLATLGLLAFWGVYVQRKAKRFWRPVGTLVVIVIALTTIKWLPALELWRKGFVSFPRLGGHFSFVDVMRLPELVFPLFHEMFLRDHEHFSLYVGFLPILLACFAFFARRKRQVQALGIVAVAALGVGFFLFPLCGFALFFWALSGLIGFGCEEVLHLGFADETEERGVLIFERVLRGLFWGALGMVGILLVALLKRSWLIERLGSAEVFYELYRGALVGMAILAASAWVLKKRLEVHGEELFFSLLLVGLVLWQLYPVNSRRLHYAPLKDVQEQSHLGGLVRDQARTAGEPLRLFRSDELKADDSAGSAARSTLEGSASILAQVDVLTGLGGRDPYSPFYREPWKAIAPATLFHLWNVPLLLMPAGFGGFPGGRFVQVQALPELDAVLWRDPAPLPRARIVFHVDSARNAQAFAQGVNDGRWNLEDQAIVMEPEGGAPVNAVVPRVRPSIQWLDRSADRVSLRVDSQGTGLLVLAEKYDPLWSVYINGVKARVLRTNDLFRGCWISGGSERIDFIYEPLTYRWAKIISFSSFAALGILLLHPFTWKTFLRAFSLTGSKRA